MPHSRPCLAYLSKRALVFSIWAFSARAGAESASYCRQRTGGRGDQRGIIQTVLAGEQTSMDY